MKVQKIEILLEEARRHQYFLEEEPTNIQQIVATIDFFKIEDVVLTDAFLFSFIKLQNVVNKKIFPYLYKYLAGRDRNDATFIDLLHSMERFKIIGKASE